MKRILLTLLAVIVALGLFAASGYAGYRFGYIQGAQATTGSDNLRPGIRPFDDFGPRGMPMHRFGVERGFQRGWAPGGFPMMGFGLFSPWIWFGRLAVLVLVVWFVYWLFTRSGWRLTRQPAETRPSTEGSASKAENE